MSEGRWRVGGFTGGPAIFDPAGDPIDCNRRDTLEAIAAALNERDALRADLDAARARVEELEQANPLRDCP